MPNFFKVSPATYREFGHDGARVSLEARGVLSALMHQSFLRGSPRAAAFTAAARYRG